MFNSKQGDLVSVVVPSYNHEHFISAALDSVAHQTYESIELIVIDDQSQDNTMSMAAEWMSSREIQKRFTQIKLLRNNKNLGAHNTINKGISEAKGDFVTILNSDDLFTPERLMSLVDAMVGQDTGFAFTKVLPIDANNLPVDNINLPKTLQGLFEDVDRCTQNYPAIGFGFLRRNIAISTGNLLINRKLFEMVGKFRSLLYVHDWDFILRALLVCEPAFVPKPYYLYRLHGSNSFSQLGNVAEIETEAVAKHFWDMAEQRKVTNQLAPVPQNWPYLLELFLGELPLLKKTWRVNG